jgi:hypothetical protein
MEIRSLVLIGCCVPLATAPKLSFNGAGPHAPIVRSGSFRVWTIGDILWTLDDEQPSAGVEPVLKR